MMEVSLKLPGDNDFSTQEAYNVLRTNIQFCGQDIRVIEITSCNENEGKSTVSLHLAKGLAELGKMVLVIDADMRKSVMAGRNTTARRPAGLSEVLTGMSALNDCIYKTQYGSMHILFAGQYPPNPVELLNSKYFTMLVNRAREVYDYVIIDTPPLGYVIDAAVIAPNCDGSIIVISDGNVSYHRALEIKAQLEKAGSKILGVVQNNAKKRNGSYYYKKDRYYAGK